MTPRDDPLLCSAVTKAVSAFSAVAHAGESLPAFMRLLGDSKLGLTPDERNALQNVSERRLVAEIWAEVTRRRGEACWPHGAQQKQATH